MKNIINNNIYEKMSFSELCRNILDSSNEYKSLRSYKELMERVFVNRQVSYTKKDKVRESKYTKRYQKIRSIKK